MKTKMLLLCSLTALLAMPLTGCVSAINTKDVTKITQTMTGLKICQSQIDKTPQLIFGREQVEYLKVPTGLNGGGTGTNNAPGTPVSDTPLVVSSYELKGKSPIFGNANMTTTFAVGKEGVATLLGGAHQPINTGDTNGPAAAPPTPVLPPGALKAIAPTNAAVASLFSPEVTTAALH